MTFPSSHFFARSSLDGLGELAVVEGSVKSVLRQQLLVLSLFDDVAVAHDQDEVGMPDGREPMRDDEARLVLHQPFHRLLDEKSLPIRPALLYPHRS